MQFRPSEWWGNVSEKGGPGKLTGSRLRGRIAFGAGCIPPTTPNASKPQRQNPKAC